MSLDDKLDAILARHAEVGARLSTGEVPSGELAALSKEYSDLSTVAAAIGERRELEREAADLEAMLEDDELGELAASELPELRDRLAAAERALQLLLLPRDEADARSAIVEVRAGTGGDEAALFAGDLLAMYRRYAEMRRWKVEMLSHLADAARRLQGSGDVGRRQGRVCAPENTSPARIVSSGCPRPRARAASTPRPPRSQYCPRRKRSMCRSTRRT